MLVCVLFYFREEWIRTEIKPLLELSSHAGSIAHGLLWAIYMVATNYSIINEVVQFNLLNLVVGIHHIINGLAFIFLFCSKTTPEREPPRFFELESGSNDPIYFLADYALIQCYYRGYYAATSRRTLFYQFIMEPFVISWRCVFGF